MKLHLGCGNTLMKGGINIDLYSGKSDEKKDVIILPGYKNDTVDEIYTSHMIEHISPQGFRKALKRWYGILKKGGILIIRCPDIRVHLKRWLEATDEERFSDPGLRNCILGIQNHPGMFNRNLFTPELLAKYLEIEGFTVVESRNVSPRNPKLRNTLSNGISDAGDILNAYPDLRDIWCKAQK